MALLDNLDDPQKLALLTMGLGLLHGPTPQKTSFLGDVSQSGLLGVQTYGKAKIDERANRASDLQQLAGTYNLVKQQEFQRMAQAYKLGQPYVPNPLLGQYEARMGQLAGLGNLSGKTGGSAPTLPPAPPQSSPMPSAPAPGMAPPSQSPMADPNYQPPMVRAPQPPQQSAAAPGLPGGFGGPAGGIPMEVWAAQDPTGKSYLEQLAKDNQPVVLRQGDLVGKNPDGSYKSLYQQPQSVPGVLPTRDNSGQVTSFREGPGFAQAAGNIKGAETSAVAAAEDPHTMVQVEMADGRKVMVPRSSLIAAGKPTAAGLPFVTSPAQAQQAPKVAQVTVTQPSTQADPWSTIPKRSVPQGMGQSTYDAAMTKLQADTASKLAEKYGAQADVAQGRQALNNQALDLVNRADTGMGAAFIGDVKNVLVSRFGIPESDFKNDPAATAALNKDLMNAAIAKAKASFGARMSTNEVNNMLKRGAANGDMLMSSIKFLLNTDNVTADYQIQQGNNLGKYLSAGGDPLQFEAWHAKTFPLSQTLDKMHLPANTPANNNADYGWSVKRVNP
jgi:hypothetical protein